MKRNDHYETTKEYFDLGRSTIDSGTYMFKKQWGIVTLSLSKGDRTTFKTFAKASIVIGTENSFQEVLFENFSIRR
jgi:hypothetical protein